MKVEINTKEIFRLQFIFISFLLIANIIGIISRIYFDHDYIYGLVPLFDFNTEKNIPTLYSSMALIFASILLLFITLMHKSQHEPYFLWGLLSFIFLFLSIDETSSIHESFGSPTRDLLGVSGLLYYAWVIPYGAALLVFVIAYLKFLLALPKQIMQLFILSGGLFVLGAIGFEMLGGWQAEINGSKGLLYSIFYSCEEFLEMLGIATFIYTLFCYLLIKNENFNIAIISKL